MSEGGEKRRKKKVDAEQPSESKSGRRREKKEPISESNETSGVVDSKKKSKRSKAEKEVEENDHVEIDLGSAAQQPPRRRKKKQPVESVQNDDMLDSSEEEAKAKANEAKKAKSGGVNKLQQSRKWDQEELEVVVPEDELSDEDAHEGASGEANGHRRAGPTPLLDYDEVQHLDDDEKAKLDWLTRVMPDEVLRNIYTNLDPVSIDQSALVCHRTNNLVQERDVWAHFKADWGHVSKDRFSRARTRAGFAACYNHEMKERRLAAERKEEAEWRAYLEAGSEWAKGFMTLFLFNRSIDYFSLFAFILGTCFAAARCQEAITWNWRIVLIPFYIPMLQIWLTPLAYDLSRIYFTSDNIDEITESLTVWHAIIARFRQVRQILYLFNLAFLVFFILLMIKLNDNLDGIPAGVTIIPWLVFLVIALEECIFGFLIGESYNESEYSVDRFFLAGLSFISIPWLIMMVLKMDGVVTANWVVVLVPFWVLMAWMIFVPGTLFVLYGCWYSLRDYSRLTGGGNGGGTGFFIWAMFGCMGIIPILTWACLVALNLDGYYHRSWPVVFIPLFVGQGLLFFGCLFTDFIIWLD